MRSSSRTRVAVKPSLQCAFTMPITCDKSRVWQGEVASRVIRPSKRPSSVTTQDRADSMLCQDKRALALPITSGRLTNDSTDMD